MKALLAVLIVCGSVWAQPVNGPVTMFEGDSGSYFSEVQLSIVNDSSALILARNVADSTTVFVQALTLPEFELAQERAYVPHFHSYQSSIDDFVAKPSGDWVILGGYWFRIQIAHLHDGNLSYREFSPPCFDIMHSGYATFAFRQLQETLDGWLVTARNDYVSGPYFEPAYCSVNIGVGPDSISYFETGDLPFLILDEFYRIVLSPQDSLLAFLRTWFDWDNPLRVMNLTREIQWGDSGDAYTCGNSILDLQYTGGGRLVALQDSFVNLSHSYLSVAEVTSPGECVRGLEYAISYGEYGIGWNPVWGWAVAIATERSLQLVRIDTSGVLHLEEGTIVWQEPEWESESPEVQISDAGEVIVLWRELDPGLELRHRYKIASVDWNTPLNAPDGIEPLPHSFSLSAFPNPFNSSVTIEYEIAKAGEIELFVFNTLGQKVETLFEGRASFGKHEATWSPSGSSGVYFVKLVSGDLQESRKILYIR